MKGEKEVTKLLNHPYKDYVRKSGFNYFLPYNNNSKREISGDIMQAVLNKIDNTSSSIQYFLSKLENADNIAKNEIENSLVNLGKTAVSELVEQLQIVQGIKRGVVAMTLIRIGDDSIEYLQRAAKTNKEFEWVAKYLIAEIGCKVA